MSRHPWRRALLWSASAVMLASAPAAVAADFKIGFIDSERIFEEYEKTREAQTAFNREVQELSKTARTMKSEVDELQRKLDAQSPMLSEAQRDKQNEVLQKKIAEYETFVQGNWGPSGKVVQLNQEYLRPIIDRVHAIVLAIATDEGYSLVLDAADGNIIFGDKALDLTDRVLGGLRQEDQGIPFRTTRTGGAAAGQPSGTGTQGNPGAEQ